MGPFDVNFCPETTIKGQALANFIVEFTYADTAEVIEMADIAETAKVVEAQEEKNSILMKEDTEQWSLYVDNASIDTGSEAGIMLISPEDKRYNVCYASDSKRQTTRPNMRPL